jgi:hypothetical protein
MNAKILIFLTVAILILVGLRFGSMRFSTGETTLNWKANTETNLAGYKIYYGTSPRTDVCPQGGYDSSIDIGNKTSYTIKKLKRNTKYYFSTTGYNTRGEESCFSEEVSKRIE